MEIKTIYIADDGAQFDSEYDCKIHEVSTAAEEFKDTLFFYDDGGYRITDILDNYDNVCYITIKDVNAIEVVEIIANLLDCYSPWESNQDLSQAIGTYCYDYSDDKWFLIEDKIAELEEEISQLKIALDICNPK